MKTIPCGALVLVAAALVLGGCVDDNGDPEPVTPPPPAAPEWSAPVAVAPGGCPIESRDGAYLYTAAGTAGSNGLDIWVLKRNAQMNTYDSRTKLADPVSVDGANDFCPTPLTGDWLMFVSTREAQSGESPRCSDAAAPGLGGADIFVTRMAVSAPATAGGTLTMQSNAPAQRLGCYPNGPNNRGTKFSPSLLSTPDGTFLFFSSDHNGTAFTGSQDLYYSELRPRWLLRSRRAGHGAEYQLRRPAAECLARWPDDGVRLQPRRQHGHLHHHAHLTHRSLVDAAQPQHAAGLPHRWVCGNAAVDFLGPAAAVLRRRWAGVSQPQGDELGRGSADGAGSTRRHGIAAVLLYHLAR